MRSIHSFETISHFDLSGCLAALLFYKACISLAHINTCDFSEGRGSNVLPRDVHRVSALD